jgi:DNA invertase Pin-like site-specific DNA recombinase
MIKQIIKRIGDFFRPEEEEPEGVMRYFDDYDKFSEAIRPKLEKLHRKLRKDGYEVLSIWPMAANKTVYAEVHIYLDLIRNVQKKAAELTS